VQIKFLIIMRGTRQKLENYIEYGSKLVLNDNGSMNLSRLTDWLISHHIYFRAVIMQIKNPFIKYTILRRVNFINNQSLKSNMFISDDEMEILLSSMERGDNDMCWNFDNSL